ncbi:type II and III secretion system protein family protein (plasmid) [Azospirillum argentinense]|uniref:Type II and III secretion system protein family protein n=1 Tax=Azospirillum argentinense TaxID=2970906 RepID=A0A4D8PWQ5_9PROT|nr:type II and III secretion system protein family protein [Azospirillum argentinense]QCN99169.1 type II and III secretion system protein family protein [Azospirillum argentinense]
MTTTITTTSRVAAFKIIGAALLAGLFAALAAAPAQSQQSQAQQRPREITLEVGGGQPVNLPAPAASVFTSAPEIADVQASGPQAFFIVAKTPGRASVYALSADNKPLASFSVVVTMPVGDLRSKLVAQVPNAAIDVQSTGNGITLTGTVSSPATARQMVELAERYVGQGQTVTNRLTVAAPAQVNLRVRVAEVSRQVTKELGVNFESMFNIGSFAFGIATGRPILDAAGNLIRALPPTNSFGGSYRSSNGRVDINTVVDALAEDGLITVLAEPNLTALSGETASFLAGGEFPIPVAQYDRTTTIQFKKYGVSLDFTPTVLGGGQISMRVRPEVSELTNNGAVVVDSIRIPGLSVRRAETTIELASGQSFAIAGLLQNNTSATLDAVPGLGDVPVLGALFHSSKFRRNETELVIVVTPYLVRPVSAANALSAPTDGFVAATDVERIFLNRAQSLQPPAGGSSGAGTAPLAIGPGAARLHGDAGFSLQ